MRFDKIIGSVGSFARKTFKKSDNAGKVAEGTENKSGKEPSSVDDKVDISSSKQLPTKRVIQEKTDGFIQNKGIIKESKEIVEKNVLDTDGIKSGDVKSGKVDEDPQVLRKEVTLASGLKITEYVDDKTITVGKKVGHNNYKTLAMIEDATLSLPQESKGIPFASMFGLQENRDNVVIQSKNMKQEIAPDGTITIHDKNHGEHIKKTSSEKMKEVGTNLGVAGVAGIGLASLGTAGILAGGILGQNLGKWQTDKYTITPDGQLKGVHYHKKLEYQPLGFPKETIKEVEADARLHPNGTIEAKREAPDRGVQILLGEDKSKTVLLKPFVNSNWINTPGQPPEAGAVEKGVTAESSAGKTEGPLAGGEIHGPNKEKFDLNALIDKSIERNTDPKTGVINSRAVFMELFD